MGLVAFFVVGVAIIVVAVVIVALVDVLFLLCFFCCCLWQSVRSNAAVCINATDWWVGGWFD